MGKSLLLEDGGDLAEEDLTLKVNSSYAARLEVRDATCIHKKFAAFLLLPVSLLTIVVLMQHNKRREELHRLQEKHPELAARLAAGGDEAEDTSSDDDEVRLCHACSVYRCTSTPRHLRGSSAARPRMCQACQSAQDDGLEPPQEEQRFLDVLAKLKTRDGALYASSGPLFPDARGSGDDDGERPERSAKRQKVLTLATVNAQQARSLSI